MATSMAAKSQSDQQSCFHDPQTVLGQWAPSNNSRVLLDPLPANPYRSNEALYAQLMMTQGRGFPLYIPVLSTTLPEEQFRRGICIGDVGLVLDNGIFDFLFNIFLPLDHPINGGKSRVPQNFLPLDELGPAEVDVYAHPPMSYVANGFMKTTFSPISDALSFRSTALHGAICGLPCGSTVKKVLDLEKLRRYAVAHADDWYHHAIVKRGRIAVNGSLYLITGTEKTDSWGTATVLQHYDGGSCMHLVHNPTDRANPYYWIHSPSYVTAETNQRDAINATGCKNQTLFIHGFKMGLGEQSWIAATDRRRSVMKIHDPRTSPIARLFFWLPKPVVSLFWRWPSWFANFYFAPFANPFFPPSIIITEYLLGRVPSANVVVTHDDDWAAIFKENEPAMPDAAETLRRIQAKYDIVNKNGVAYLTPKIPRES